MKQKKKELPHAFTGKGLMFKKEFIQDPFK